MPEEPLLLELKSAATLTPTPSQRAAAHFPLPHNTPPSLPPIKPSRLSDTSPPPPAPPSKNGYTVDQTHSNPSAMDWVLDKANQGNAEAQVEVARRYGTGQGVPQNFEKALE
ncbi:hypothetical protein BGZ90_007655, partial [Linnemannia elongata]